MISELRNCAAPKPPARPPDDAQATLDCADYLEAMNCMFQKGALSRLPVGSSFAPPMKQMDAAMHFIRNWYLKVHEKNAFSNRLLQRRAFWAQETFDSFRYVYFGLRTFVARFTQTFPGYYLILHRFTGSPVESVFSALRYYSANNLTSINYEATLQRVRCISNARLKPGKRKHNDEFGSHLNQPLNFKDCRVR
jgi:hypothetical protein